jgi:hypothetical protein
VLLIAVVCTFVLPFFFGCSVAKTILDVTSEPAVTPSEENLVIVDDLETPEVDEGTTPVPEETPEPTAEPTATAEPNRSSTTGRSLPDGFVYRPVIAVIDNAAQSRPQTGLMLADVVYEFLLDRSSYTTRYLAVFSDEIPERIGPVRDSRDYLANTALEWGGLYISEGDPLNAGEDYMLIRESGIRLHAENSGADSEYFYTDKTVTAIEEHTLFFKALDYVESFYTNSVPAGIGRFEFEDGVSYEKAKPFTSVGIPFSSSDMDRVVFTYDAETNRMTRSDKNSKNVLGVSKTLTPAENVLGYENEPIVVQNLIIQYVRVSSYDSTYRDITLTGSGDCVFFINGQYIIGSWSRPALDDITAYKLYDGTIIRLQPGNTWIEMMPTNHDIRIVNAD